MGIQLFLVGRLFEDSNHTHEGADNTEPQIALANPRVHAGGWFRPSNCHSRHRVALIIPYRDREQHLLVLLAHLHPILQRQQLSYKIYVVEQVRYITII